jgi:PPOX class probable F420-dependent enzyme
LNQIMDRLSDAARELLSEVRFAVVAVVGKDGMPRQFVMWYELRGDGIMMNTRVGTAKEQRLRHDSRISVCVEDGYRYVTVKGRAELDYDMERARADKRALAIRYYGREKGEQLARDVYSHQERVTIYVSIDKVDEHL